MNAFALGKHLVWSRRDANGATISYYYYDEITWAAAALALLWLVWLLVRGYRRRRAQRRPPRRGAPRPPKRVVRAKRELSSRYLRPGFSANIHAVGVGALAGGGGFCIQVFVADANAEPWPGAGAGALPADFRGVPLELIEMPESGFLSDAGPVSRGDWEKYSAGIRGQQEVIIGGISGANANLTGQSGTIGYFCTRRSLLPRRREVHMLSNSHVFADLCKAAADEGDLIIQPSPGEPSENRPIGALVNYSPLKFGGDAGAPNHVDAAIARLWDPLRHEPLIPLIGALKGYAEAKDVELGETARKFGRTTGYTVGCVFSVHLDIRVRYDRTGQTAFFRDQFLIEPTQPPGGKFVAKGDSGSLLVDARQYAIGLIFAGTSERPDATHERAEATPAPPPAETRAPGDPSAAPTKRIEGYGVANPISEVLDRLKVDLLI